MPYDTTESVAEHSSRLQPSINSEASFEGGWGAVAPEGKRKKKERKKREKKENKERKKGTMNNVKLLHIKCCFYPIFQ